jgi:hypothetical protein
MYHEDYDYEPRSFRGGNKAACELQCRIKPQAFNTLRNLQWDVTEPPRAAKTKLLLLGDSSWEQLPDDLVSEKLCSAKLVISLPVTDPTETPVQVVELTISKKGGINIRDILSHIWKFYNDADPPQEVVDSIHAALTAQNSGLGYNIAPSKFSQAYLASNQVTKFIRDWTANRVVHPATLLRGNTKFHGLILLEDGTYYAELSKTPR